MLILVAISLDQWYNDTYEMSSSMAAAPLYAR